MKTETTVMGVDAPPSRILLRGFILAGLVFGTPVVGVLFLIDLLRWLM
jgi:hypothetical protein